MKRFGITCFHLTFILIGIVLIATTSCSNKSPETVTDVDGNVYKTIKIGKQVWMAENLKVTKYRNGDLIPNITDTAQWGYTPAGAYCNYNNSDSVAKKYGRLYNWYAITDERGIAPKGWHIPTTAELKTLIEYLEDETVAGGKMKMHGDSWLAPNQGATNESSFSALPGGYRFNKGGSFHTLGSNGYCWTTTESYELYAWTPRLYYRFADTERDYDYRTYGFSVRCIRDNE